MIITLWCPVSIVSKNLSSLLIEPEIDEVVDTKSFPSDAITFSD